MERKGEATMPPYIFFLLAGIALAMASEKLDQLAGGRLWVRRLITRLAPLLVLIGMAQGAVELIFR